jgi:excisionase family DNA binding protein
MTQPYEDRASRLSALKEELVGGLILSPAEVADVLEIHQRTVLDYIHSGRLEAWQLGGSWKIPEAALRKFVLMAKRGGQDLDKRSPFDAVTWTDDDYTVEVKGDSYRLLSIDDVPFSNIVAFARRQYKKVWQKRIDEDLVEILHLLGSQPGPEVSLRLQRVEWRTAKN